MKLYLFLRSIVWTSVLSILGFIASIALALVDAPIQTVLATSLASVSLAILSTKVGD